MVLDVLVDPTARLVLVKLVPLGEGRTNMAKMGVGTFRDGEVLALVDERVKRKEAA